MPSTPSSPRRIFTVPDDMPGHSIPQPPRVVQAIRLDTLRAALTGAGLSEVVLDSILRTHNPTTSFQFQSNWAKFISFLYTKECLITNVIQYLSIQYQIQTSPLKSSNLILYILFLTGRNSYEVIYKLLYILFT